MNLPDNTALILMDLQQGFDIQSHWGGKRNNPNAEQICAQILSLWRDRQMPIFHVRHSSQDPNSELHSSKKGFNFKEETKPIPEEITITKNVNSAFIGTDLKAILDNQNINTLVIVGLTTNHCVSTTARMAGNYGFNTYVISDATATFDRIGVNGDNFDAEIMHQTALASLHGEFATVISSIEIIEQLNIR